MNLSGVAVGVENPIVPNSIEVDVEKLGRTGVADIERLLGGHIGERQRQLAAPWPKFIVKQCLHRF